MELYFFIIILFAFPIVCIPGTFLFIGDPFRKYKKLTVSCRFCFLLVFFATLAIIFALGELFLQYLYGRYFLQSFIGYGILSALPSAVSFIFLLTKDS